MNAPSHSAALFLAFTPALLDASEPGGGGWYGLSMRISNALDAVDPGASLRAHAAYLTKPRATFEGLGLALAAELVTISPIALFDALLDGSTDDESVRIAAKLLAQADETARRVRRTRS
jgi:hypothetical protein